MSDQMPDYTLEQKAAAFDALWLRCGPGKGVFIDYKLREVRRGEHDATFERIPRFSFEIVFTGQVDTLKDVLHYLATNERILT